MTETPDSLIEPLIEKAQQATERFRTTPPTPEEREVIYAMIETQRGNLVRFEQFGIVSTGLAARALTALAELKAAVDEN